ncbi:13545_t:CDS:2 [Ambispora gerdemannii]|uniref:13545_t:CDS:1 n=1 Tax=Ambispora gerdemannii TaxID=144530 RepID=A0A9N8VZC1_9GLOM|nr:13545_t:CDS:2 [Ambispora gerdemannii]
MYETLCSEKIKPPKEQREQEGRIECWMGDLMKLGECCWFGLGYPDPGTFEPGYNIKSYRWDSPSHDGCCVKMCNYGSEVGYW